MEQANVGCDDVINFNLFSQYFGLHTQWYKILERISDNSIDALADNLSVVTYHKSFHWTFYSRYVVKGSIRYV